jgi:hypothetical protein
MQHTGGPIGAAERQAAVLPMRRFSTEPTLADLFGDPMTYVMMAADHIDYWDLDALLLRARHFVVGRTQHQLGD